MEKAIAIARAVQLEEVVSIFHVYMEQIFNLFINKTIIKCMDFFSKKKRLRAIQCVRDEEDFKSSLQKMREEEEREENKKKAMHLNKDKYREEIISQMTQKEMNRRELKEKLKREFVADVEAQKQTER